MFINNKTILSILLISNISAVSNILANTQLAEVEERSIPVDTELKSSNNQVNSNILPSPSNKFNNLPRTEVKTNSYWSKISYNNDSIKPDLEQAQAIVNAQSNSNINTNSQQTQESEEGIDNSLDNKNLVQNNADEYSNNLFAHKQEQLINNSDSTITRELKPAIVNSNQPQYKDFSTSEAKQTYKEVGAVADPKSMFTFTDSDLNAKSADEAKEQALRELQNMSPIERLTRLENIIEQQKSQHYENKIKSLQDEVQELRGLLEAERHKVEKSLAQQKLLYEDLDRRFTQVKNNAGQSTTTSNFSFQDKKIEQQDLYTEAYQSIKQRDYPKAIKLFNKYIETYPEGIFCANSNYWLGEIYMLQSDYPKALVSFDVVLDKYPKSSKAADAMYKKALVYIYLKEFTTAKQILAKVKQQYKNTTVARLADKKLQGIENLNDET